MPLTKLTEIKVFIDGHSFDREFQGTRTFLRELYLEIAGKTDRLIFYIGAYDVANLEKEFGTINNVHFVQYSSSSAMKRLNIDIPRIIKTHGIHFAHFQYIAPFRKHCKYIVTTHDILFNDFKDEFSFSYRVLRNFLFRYGIRRADIKTTVSDYSRKRISHHYGISPADIHVIKNGVGERFYEPYNKLQAGEYIKKAFGIDNYILYVSRLEPRKNHILVLRTFLEEKLYEKGIKLVFIGRENIPDRELIQLISAMPENARANFFRIDQVDDATLLEFYRAARVFAYPSKAEGFGIPPLEAGAMRIPVLCSNKTAMSDFTFFGDHLFNPRNTAEFAQKLNTVLFSPSDTDRCNRISDTIRQDYSWASSANTLLKLILENH